jgi:16S rRNA (cytidine1402-2'-O)-methyltransferase
MHGKLFLVSTPIGNYEDITLRALKILKQADVLVCEELKMGRRLLSKYEIQKELLTLNEHNEEEASEEIVRLLLDGKDVAVFSDAGTPLFSDPGQKLAERCIANKIKVVPVPGASSIMTALVGSGLIFKEFYYRGWLSPKREIRRKELLELKKRKELIILLETPYRLKTLVADIVKYFGKNQFIVVAFDLTLPSENFFRGKAQEILSKIEKENLKGEFVLLLDNR